MNNKKQAWIYIASSALLLASGYALANNSGTIGDVAGNLTDTMSSFTKLISAGSYVAGIALALGAMVKFKTHKDAPTQTKLSEPMVLLMVAAGLIFLPSVISSVGGSLFGSGGKTADSKGSGFE